MTTAALTSARPLGNALSLTKQLQRARFQDRIAWERSVMPTVLDLVQATLTVWATLAAVIALAVVMLLMALDPTMSAAQVGLTGGGFLLIALPTAALLIHGRRRSFLRAVAEGQVRAVRVGSSLVIQWTDQRAYTLAMPRLFLRHPTVRRSFDAGGIYLVDPTVRILAERAAGRQVDEAGTALAIEAGNERLARFQETIAQKTQV